MVDDLGIMFIFDFIVGVYNFMLIDVDGCEVFIIFIINEFGCDLFVVIVLD